MNYMNVSRLIVCFAAIITSVPFYARADECPNKISIASTSKVFVQQRELNQQEKTALTGLLADLKCARREVYEKPDLLAMVETYPAKEGQALNVYLRESYLFPGEYLDAWTERMEGRGSKVYLLDNKTRDFLTKVFAQGQDNK